jgi:hypothetical protein
MQRLPSWQRDLISFESAGAITFAGPRRLIAISLHRTNPESERENETIQPMVADL